MKKALLFSVIACALTACQTTQEPTQCQSCNPPTRHFEVVTECSDYTEKDLGNGSFSQCRYCTNKIYANGVDVTAQFKAAPQKVISGQRPAVRVKKVARPCEQ